MGQLVAVWVYVPTSNKSDRVGLGGHRAVAQPFNLYVRATQ
jgi:hypothetical protein